MLFRAALVGLIAATIFELCRRQGTGVRTAALLALGAFAVSAPALALRPQLIGMALFALTLFLVVDRSAHPRQVVAGRPDRGPVGERPRQLLPGARRARARLDRRRGRSLAAPAPRAGGRGGDRRGVLPDAVRPVRLGLRGAARCEPGGDRSDQRVAADLAARHLRDPVLRVRVARRGLPCPPRTADAVADAAVARRLLRDRRLRRARDRVVAIRRGGRPRAAHRRGPAGRRGA